MACFLLCLLSVAFVVDATLQTSPTDKERCRCLKWTLMQVSVCVASHIKLALPKHCLPHLLGVASIPFRRGVAADSPFCSLGAPVLFLHCCL